MEQVSFPQISGKQIDTNDIVIYGEGNVIYFPEPIYDARGNSNSQLELNLLLRESEEFLPHCLISLFDQTGSVLEARYFGYLKKPTSNYSNGPTGRLTTWKNSAKETYERILDEIVFSYKHGRNLKPNILGSIDCLIL